MGNMIPASNSNFVYTNMVLFWGIFACESFLFPLSSQQTSFHIRRHQVSPQVSCCCLHPTWQWMCLDCGQNNCIMLTSPSGSAFWGVSRVAPEGLLKEGLCRKLTLLGSGNAAREAGPRGGASWVGIHRGRTWWADDSANIESRIQFVPSIIVRQLPASTLVSVALGWRHNQPFNRGLSLPEQIQFQLFVHCSTRFWIQQLTASK